MQVRCLHCHEPTDVANDSDLGQIVCTSCGGSFSIVPEQTTPYDGTRKLGRFELLEQAGAGAFGAVWKARDPELDRIVAVKVPRKGALSANEAEMFLREARAAAQLKHQSIVSVHEVGREADSVYIVSDFVRGATLDDWLASQRVTPREAAEICTQLADALQHAHAVGVIHRDLKPGNVMMDLEGRPHLMDFGLARRTAGEATMTVAGRILGTPAYMSPEQARGEAHTADCRTDVYSLGVILFKLLTGELPFRGSTQMLIVQILKDEPPNPRKLNHAVPRDLETICLKAMAKEPARRYQTAEELSSDLRRFLTGESIRARPVGQVGRIWRWAKRRPAAAALLFVSSIAGLIAVGGIVSLLNNHQLQVANRKTQRALEAEEEQRKLAQDAQAKAESFQYVHHVSLAHSGWRDASLNGAESLLDACSPERRRWEWNYLKRLFHGDSRTFYDPADAVDDVEQGGLAVSPDGLRIASVGSRGGILIWDAMDGRVVRRLPGHAGGVTSLAFAPDGSLLASSSQDKTIKLWDAVTGELRRTLEGHSDWVTTVAFSPDGARLASSSTDRTVRLWDVATGREKRAPLRGHAHWVFGVAFGPDGTRLASASHDLTVRVWDATTGEELLKIDAHVGLAGSVAFSPDGTRLASCGADRLVKTWDAKTGRELLSLVGHASAINHVAFSPDGARLASAGTDQLLRVWDATTGAPLAIYRGHTGPVANLAFSPDGTWLASFSNDRRVKIWPLGLDQECRVLRGHRRTVTRAVFSPDGSRLASSSEDATVRVWDVATGQDVFVLKGRDSPLHCVAFSPDGMRLASASSNRNVDTWDATTGKLLRTFTPHTSIVYGVAYDSAGTRVASAGLDHTVVLTDSGTGQVLHRLTDHEGGVRSLAFSPDGTRLVSGSQDRSVMVWNVATGERLHRLTGHSNWVRFVAFNPDGTRIVSTGRDGLVKIWDASTGAALATLDCGVQVLSAAFHPHGARLATADDQIIRLWDVSTTQEVLTLRGHTAAIYSVAFSADGASLISAGIDQTVRIWDARPWTPTAGHEREAVGLLHELFAKPLAKADVVAHLQVSPQIHPQARRSALALVDRYREEADPKKYYAAAWPVIRHPYANVFACQFAMAQMNTACERAPNNAAYQIALGVAQYRLGKSQRMQYANALATLSNCDQHHPITLAFLTLTQHQLGQKDEARSTLDRLRALAKQPSWAANEEVQGFLREAEALVDVPPLTSR